MDRNFFINNAFTYGITEYIRNRNNPYGANFNSFYVVVIRALVEIYGELDIINPYSFRNEYSFDTNLQKYGYSLDDIVQFKNIFNYYYGNENRDGFIFIQKCLIDMFVQMKKSVGASDVQITHFRNLLYSTKSNNPLMVSYHFFMVGSDDSILNYFDSKITEVNPAKISRAKETLNLDAYTILKYSLDDIKNMSADELDAVNKKVYNYFNINENAVNKRYLLDKAVFDYSHPKKALGNGFVDVLFFLSFVAILIMVIIVVTLLVL